MITVLAIFCMVQCLVICWMRIQWARCLDGYREAVDAWGSDVAWWRAHLQRVHAHYRGDKEFE